MSNTLIPPHGDELINLLVGKENQEALKQQAFASIAWTLTERQINDLELLLSGAFSPLTGFMNQADYESVKNDMRLSDGTLWPLPITLDITNKIAEKVKLGDTLTLKDKEGFSLAVITINDMWSPDLDEEAEKVFGSTDEKHPAVAYLKNQSNPIYVGGEVQGLDFPRHYDYQSIRQTPAELREEFLNLGWDKIVAFQTRNPMHRAHVELTMRASAEINANVLIHPVVGQTKPGDIDHFTRVRCYQKVMGKYKTDSAMLSLLPLAMRMGGPREALLHAIIRKNYGCTHFIVGRDHAGPGVDSKGKPFYGPYDAQEMMTQYEDELQIKMVPFKLMVFVDDKKEYQPIDEVAKDVKTSNISGTELRRRLEQGEDIPEWFSYPEVVEELRKSQPPLNKRGFTVFFTGLSGSGKSVLANGLMVKMMETNHRPVTLLDGDIVRTHLSSELGFSQKDRSINIQRIGFVASEITKNGGIAICAPIAPYESDRQFNRKLISNYGGYIEVHVSTSLEVCEKRDVKGLYALARKGIVKEFTGISDPYEMPLNAEIVINSDDIAPELLVDKIYSEIKKLGYI
jgi:sulfate adenylyltransferase